MCQIFGLAFQGICDDCMYDDHPDEYFQIPCCWDEYGELWLSPDYDCPRGYLACSLDDERDPDVLNTIRVMPPKDDGEMRYTCTDCCDPTLDDLMEFFNMIKWHTALYEERACLLEGGFGRRIDTRYVSIPDTYHGNIDMDSEVMQRGDLEDGWNYRPMWR
ncbi:uncharacterized protein AB675_312 [Cyphellophora attinorum]|uniref:Uncharacterized protein n=1 Tax=Cyphellophora attinorum TaxID=1664694 RepID=A0A0N1HGZ7_9EURO|nr:uncharacterized protein AB675_312 [Phialophora attinorum]KPI45634.1 hypothetical protein AB675_312 [Phialophora attinorum]